VSGCLRDAMDSMFNSSQNVNIHRGSGINGHTDDSDLIVDVVGDEDSSNMQTSAQFALNKRKLTALSENYAGQQELQQPEQDPTKRMCTPTGACT
jgi:hypothetical protein